MRIHHKHHRTLLFMTILVSGIASSDDLNDGITADEPIVDDLKETLNVPYILMKAKAAEFRGKRGIESSRPVITQGQNGQGNITFGPGTKIAPGTTIINSSVIENSNSISR